MAQPTPYAPSFDFTQFATDTPAEPPPGVRLDAEYDAIALTLEEVLANLALIQRDDGQLRNASVRLATLHSEVIAALNVAGSNVVTWATGTAYSQGQIVIDGDDVYLVAIAHTSGVLATDVAAGRLIRVFDSRFIAAGTGAVSRPVQDKLREAVVSITDYGGAAGLNDNTSALALAVAALGVGGGRILFPGTAEDWLLNAVITANNITLEGMGGLGDFNEACLRPFDITKPTLTFGDGTTDYRSCGIDNLHVAGCIVDPASPSPIISNLAANNAPQAVLLKGGTINFTMTRSVLYNGIQTLALKPSLTNPVTGFRMPGSTIRNDIIDSTSARAIFSQRLADPSGYNTDNRFEGKINGPTLGYAAEFDGTAAGIAVEIGGYWDVKPGLGVLLKGSGTGIYAYGLDLDPGASNVVVIETDQTSPKDPARFITGLFRHGGQKIKWGDATTTTIPAYSEMFSHQARMSQPFLSDLVYFAPTSAPYQTSVYLDWATDTGPMRLNGIKLQFTDTTDSNSTSSGAVQLLGGLGVAKSVCAKDVVAIAGSFWVGADKVVQARKTGWAVDTGTAKRTANATYSGTAEVAYTQATIQTLMDAVRDVSQTVKALKDDLHATAGHGLLGT